jgi:GAF domain-containing protein
MPSSAGNRGSEVHRSLERPRNPREFAFCAYSIIRRGLFIIPDATRDKRFATNPFVASGPKYRFYAGAPLLTPDHHALGTLCVIDKVRRTLSATQKKI